MNGLGINCTFVPPYLLDALALSGLLPPEQVARMQRLDARFRSQRAQAAPAPDPVAAGARWQVYDAGGAEDLPGTPVRAEGDPESGDVAVDEAATGITATLDLYRDAYQRDSFDGAGAMVPLSVHFGRDYANAFWDGAHLVFGDGDGQVFGRFTAAVDVLAHEFSHAVTERTTGLIYRGQSGALNESMSDVFGACVKQRVLGQDVAGADWLIGEGLFMPAINARALRDMAAPGTAYDDPALGKDPQPGHMDDYVETNADNGGVHLNSGIPNRAFVLAAKAIGGTAAEGAGRIWYQTLTSGSVRPDADFAAFATACVAQAGDHADAVRAAWEQVGVLSSAAPTPSPAPVPTPAPTPADRVAVRRSGGIVGQVLDGELDLTSDDPRVPRVRALVQECDLGSLQCSAPQPDRYLYDFELGAQTAQVPEQDLTPPLAELASLVLRPQPGAAG